MGEAGKMKAQLKEWTSWRPQTESQLTATLVGLTVIGGILITFLVRLAA